MVSIVHKYIFSIVYIFSLLLLLVDSYGSDTTVFRFLNITSRNIAIYSIIFLAGLRIIYNKQLLPILTIINSYVIFPVSLVTCVVLTIFDYNTPPNAAFDFIKIQYIQLCIISMFSLITIILQGSNVWFKKNIFKVIFVGFFIIFGYAYLSTFFPWDIFYNISREDFFIETLQVYVLLIASLFAFIVAKQLYGKHKIHSVIFSLVAISLLIIAGDEISWGQRIFQLTAPELLANNNDQKEITIHNLSFLAGYVGIGYIVIGFYGAFAWLTQIVIPKFNQHPYYLYIPGWYSMGYFFFGFYFNYYNRVTKYHPYSVWSEFAELMLYSGIMFSLLGLYITIKNVNLPRCLK